MEHIFKVKPSRLMPAPSQVLEDSSMCSYMVPIVGNKIDGKMISQVNVKLIDEIIDFVRIDLISFCLSDNTHR